MIINTRNYITPILPQSKEKSVTAFNRWVRLDDDRVICIAANHGMGKTALALQLSLEYAQKNRKTVYIFSLEKSAEQIYERMIITLSEVDMHSFKEKLFSEEEKGKIEMAIYKLTKMNLIIDDELPFSINQIQKRLDNVSDIGLVVIDNFQFLVPDQKTNNRKQEFYEIGRQLKILSKTKKIPIVFTSHVPRRLECVKYKRPTLADLRDIGVEQCDVDTICFIYREGYCQNFCEDDNKAEIIIVKNRAGCCGSVLLEWHGRFMKFCDQYVY